MRGIGRLLGAAFLATSAGSLAFFPLLESSHAASPAPQVSNAEAVPAHHESAPTGPLPATLSPTLFSEPVAQNAYRIAARIKKVLYQQPCYCHCDRSQGHSSLLDCFAGGHAAECGVCVAEDFYAYEQTRKGKTPAQIREGIERGDWHSVDLKKYETALPAKPAK
jgi:hypothetical protein